MSSFSAQQMISIDLIGANWHYKAGFQKFKIGRIISNSQFFGKEDKTRLKSR
jgi:hypothetical protein